MTSIVVSSFVSHPFRSRLFRILVFVIFINALIQLSPLLIPSGRPRPGKRPVSHLSHGKIYISSTHWNNEAILRSRWNTAVVNLVKEFGPSNVYVSIYESGSWDDSKGALQELDHMLEALGVETTIILDETTHNDEIAKPPGKTGWIDTPRGKRELRRIPYLSRLRNFTLQPLEKLLLEGRSFDKILFLNDVVFTVKRLLYLNLSQNPLVLNRVQTEDILNLLDTRGGEYAAACSLDFSKPPKFYDTFALRDSSGREAASQTYPYFSSRASRNAISAGREVPVQSCWNGIGVYACG
ncbi:MAG: hypothetical protein M1839_003250 [Geoglossum umbratile]|nr:MAG: hypothetical protein M1839_003250 [Geoglossum umbratile]